MGPRPVFPPEQVAEVKAIACELPVARGLPLSRFTRTELHRLVIERGVPDASATTIWRRLHEEAIKPWQVRSWLFARDLAFAAKGGPGARPLRAALRPPPPDACAGARSAFACEFEYRRGGTLAYLAACDVHHAHLFGRVGEQSGIEPFGRLVEQVMTSEPDASGRRVFWIVDHGSSHAGKASIERLEGKCKNLRLIHLPVHASWLNQMSSTARSSSARR